MSNLPVSLLVPQCGIHTETKLDCSLNNRLTESLLCQLVTMFDYRSSETVPILISLVG